MQFTHSIRDKQKILRVGERVKIRVKNESGLSRGKIVAITDSSISLYQVGKIKKIALTGIDLIQKTSIGNIIALILGIGFIGTGLGSIIFLVLPEIDPMTFIAGCILSLGLIFIGSSFFWARPQKKRFNLKTERWQMQACRAYRDKRGRIKTIE